MTRPVCADGGDDDLLMLSAYAYALLKKLIMLRRCLAAGLTDDATLNYEALVVRAVRAVEAPHVSVLHVLVTESSGRSPSTDTETKTVHHRPHVWTAAEVADRLPHLRAAVHAVMAVLVREGLAEMRKSQSYGEVNTRENLYVATPFGADIFGRIQGAMAH